MIALTEQFPHVAGEMSQWNSGYSNQIRTCQISSSEHWMNPPQENHVRKTCLTHKENFDWTGKITMAESTVVCPSCRKRCVGDGRYCIYCGSILKQVYCSQCGTANPDDLEQCLECGNPIPKLTDVRWGPIVTIMQPTSAMSDERPYATEPDSEVITSSLKPSGESLLSRLLTRLKRKEKSTD